MIVEPKYFDTMTNLTNDFRHFAIANTNASASAVDKMIASQNALRAGYGSINPTIIEERKLNIATMDVFSRLMLDRIIFLGTDIDDYTSNVIQAQLLYLSSQDDSEISLYINSPGGVVYDGLGIYDTMQYVGCDIKTICTGMAASMASVLLCAGTKGKRFALPHSRVMIHQPLGGVRGQASDIEIEAKQILKLKDELYQILADHSNRTVAQIAKDADRDHWLTAQEAVDYGMIDKVLNR